MKRYVTINVLEGSSTYDYLEPDFVKGDYVVDRTHFTPVSELAKSVVGQSIGMTDLSRYDFADGQDNGMQVPVARRRPELAEMSVDVKRQQKKVKDKIAQSVAVEKFKRDVFGDNSQGIANESSQIK